MEKFSFIIHPIEIDDIYRKYKALKYLPQSITERIMTFVPPSIVSEITGLKGKNSRAEGYFIGLPLTSRIMMEYSRELVTKKIIKAGRIAEKMGAKIVGLGAFTSVVGDAGITIAKNLNIAVTTGNTYTVAAAFDATVKACNLLDKRFSDCQVAIVGATGSIGKVCAKLSCREAHNIILIGRRDDKLLELKEELLGIHTDKKIKVTTSISEGLKEADVVITVTSSIDDVIKPHYIKTGAVVCDVARPRDVSKSLIEKRQDVLVIEGGVIEVPSGTNFGFNFGFPKGLSYACMAETMILALEKRYENYSIGRDIDIQKVDEIRKLAEKHGFRLAGLRSFERVIDDTYIDHVKRAIEKRESIKEITLS
ncbi:polysaccharide biosynthesis protein [Alkaliphilus serpentinus]|uniref:Shikimate dehydrogenase n=1 Tax=Alkaliphilus serpentinus TaxID=1482731 RepID=A0A833M8R9_9FIRM|nr:polysaccharide biosynthesis protein [Alkaliphilus serpentinus]KAB3527182.1 shikimate dehydrogenase [Alkaliphilus serpentinus]